MATTSSRRLGFVILAAVLLTSLFTWRLQASGLMAAMFDSSSSPISPIVTPTPTDSRTPVPIPSRTPTPTRTQTRVPPPIVICITPDHGSDAAATRVAIRGAYFQAGATVAIGARPLADVRWVNHTELAGAVPAGLTPGAYTIHVCNPDAQCGQLADAFTVTGEAPILTAIVPAVGRNDAANEVAVFGYNLRPGVTLTVGSTPLTGFSWISDGEVRGIVPPGLPAGVYDVSARNPGVPGAGVLPRGYTVLDPTADDFFVAEADIWTDPTTLRQGETTTVLLGANIHRQGGDTARTVQVSFFRGDPGAGGVLLGAATTVPMPPAIGAVEPVFITWNPGDLVGAVSIYVVVDPDGLIPETSEANNLARRDLVIFPPARDVTPPTIVAFSANEGSQSTTDPAVRLALRATDDLSGIYSMYLAERVFNATANMWLVVQQTGWLPFQGAYELTLTGPGGARYLEVWVADAAGNVTPLPARARINYLPPSDTVLQGQVRLFRFTVAAGERLAATLTTLNAEGDADLYVWGPYHPGGRELWLSDQAGATVDAVSFVATETGEYDIEVRGWNPRSEYRLAVGVGGAAAGTQSTAAGASAAGKPIPARPADASTAAPAARGGVPAAPVAPPSKVHLPVVMRNHQPPTPRPTYRIHLPVVLRDYTAPRAPTYKIRLPIIMRSGGR
jgi:hypothetical protein